jgi:hypothetical protein
MAKRARNAAVSEQPAGVAQTAEDKFEDFAEDLGRLLGTARVKAEGWLDQRKAIAEHLTGLRDTANQLLAQLGIATRDEGAGTSRRRPGRPRKAVENEDTSSVATGGRRKKRVMSAEARARIAAAQRARWAKQKRAAGRG